MFFSSQGTSDQITFCNPECFPKLLLLGAPMSAKHKKRLLIEPLRTFAPLIGSLAFAGCSLSARAPVNDRIILAVVYDGSTPGKDAVAPALAEQSSFALRAQRNSVSKTQKTQT